MDLFEIGRKATVVSLYVALFSSIITLALFSGGVDRSLIKIPLLMGAKPFYDRIQELSSKLPQGEFNVYVFLASGFMALGGVLINFMTVLLGLFIIMSQSLISIIPNEIIYLASPLVFVMSFLQFTVWLYVVKSLIDIIRGFFIFRV